ncbi:efflux RND transporter periplasmic adaptor subunit [Desulfopila sp. IMCC35008]|uniref:efflux RND transporter periplasmic adaptor subunit n=1 Tax=Desulfopila sp. IMCC35008 TaxID=2653858 RepID=UPI0013D41CCD|nr:HlyD family efflux transporter periplasmic adaptor subunit [Desulfopila sp. IMCC35008]
MKISKKILFFLPVAAGLVLLFLMVSNKKAPVRQELTEKKRSVSVVEVKARTVIPRVTGYGYVKPTETWQAIPEVSGRIIQIHPELKRGAFISKGDLLVRIDPQTYGLAESRGAASVMSVEARLIELEQQRINNEKLLEIEQQALRLFRQEMERKRNLYDKGYISASDLELEEKNMLAQEASVNSLLNTLKLIPAQEKALLAEKESGVSNLSERRLDIEKTIIRAPFDCRIAEVNIELDQFAPAGTQLIEAISISAVEIPVQLSPSAFAGLLSTSPQELLPVFQQSPSMDKIREVIGISAKVSIPLFNKTVEWDGTFMRTAESIDMSTGTIAVYVSVQNPYDQVKPGERPPLVPNMYTQVELKGRARTNRFIVPVQAIHNGTVYTVDADSRLKSLPVEVEMVMGNLAIIKEGFMGNATVITTDLIPAVEGMLLAPQIDEELTAEIDALDDEI